MHFTIRASKRQYKKIPLLLRMFGSDHLQDAIHRPAGLTVWQLLYCVSGTGEFHLEGRRSLLRPGQLAVIAPHDYHGYRSTGGDWVVHYLGFNGSVCAKLMAGLGLSQSGGYTLSHPEEFDCHIRVLEGLLSGGDRDKSLLCSKELYSTLLDVAASVTRLPQTEYSEFSDFAREMVLYLEEHFGEDISLEGLSEQFHFSREYLCERFKAETGKTIMGYLKGIRIHQARLKLMELPDESLETIGRACGFHSPSYFGKVFREATGMTPHAYRIGTFLKK